jgi:molecular chaperone DnaK (HSP70)
MLMFSEGVSIAHARHALDLASRGPDLGLLQLEVFEADAAAQAYAQLCPNPSRALLVFDMGAGTTDFAGFILSEDGNGRTLEELTAARQCIGLAGDEIDAILVEVAQEKIATKTRAQSRALARMLALEAREAKRILFQTGRCQLMGPSGKRVQIKRSEIERHPLFREFAAALREAFTHSLTPLFAEARARGIDKVSVILAGGGSILALLADIARRAGPDIEVVRFEETWGGFKDSAGAALPQTAIVIGGALTR